MRGSSPTFFATTLVKRNLASNFGATAWIALLNLVFIPVYIRILGVEAFGLIGFFISLQVVLLLLDMGTGMTFNRELARTPTVRSRRTIRLFQTMESSYWLVAVLIAVSLAVAAPAIANHWIQPEALSPAGVQQSIRLMGLAIALHFPFGLYSGGLLGLQKHVSLSMIVVLFGTLRWAGAAAVLLWIDDSLGAFFGWMAIVAALQTATLGSVLGSMLGSSFFRRSFDLRLLWDLKGFAVRLSGIAILGTALTQADKIILSRLATLESFGYYSVAAVIASGLALLPHPVFATVYPRFSQLHASHELAELERLYHRSSQLVSGIVMAGAVSLALFSREILLLWTRNVEVADRAAPILSILSAGFALYGLIQIPIALELSTGWTSLVLRLNLLALVLFVPLSIIGEWHAGAMGVAISWTAVFGAYVVVLIPAVHTRSLRTSSRQWLFADLFPPLGAALLSSAFCRAVVQTAGDRLPLLPLVVVSLVLILVASLLSTPVFREWLRELASRPSHDGRR